MDEMALDAVFDPRVYLAAHNANFMQIQSFDNSLVENEPLQNLSLSNASSTGLTLTGSMIASSDVDPIALYTNPTVGSNTMGSSLGSRSVISEGVNMNGNFSANMGSSLKFTEQTLTSSFQTSSAGNGPQVARKKQQPNSSIDKSHDSLPNMIIHDPISIGQRLKKRRLEVSEEAVCGQSVSQQVQQTARVQSTVHKHQIPGLIQQYMLHNRNQLEASQSAPPYDVLIQSQNQLMSNKLQQRVVHGVHDAHAFNEGVCTRRLLQYMYHLRHRPADNNIAYWRKFVTEYFAPGARKRWCVSLYDKVGLEAKSVIRKSAMSAWQCSMCGCGSGRGFDVIFDSLARLTKLVYDSGVIDELLFLDLPQTYRLPSGLLMLKYEKVTQESVYENFRVVHEGQLCIVFTHYLKILSWEFCAHRHEVFVSRCSVMSQMAQAEQKYRNDIINCRLNGALLHDSQVNRNRFQTIGGWIAHALNFGLVDDLGFAKRYARCLQIAEIVQSMKDLMAFSQANQMGPIESLKHLYPELSAAKLKKQEINKMHVEGQGHSVENSIPPSPIASRSRNNFSNAVKEHCTTSPEEATSMLLSHSNNNKVAFEGQRTSSSRSTTNFAENVMSSSSRWDQSKEHRAIQKILQEMINNNRTVNESARQVTSTLTRMCEIREARTTLSNNLWAAPNMDLSESAASQSSSMENQV